MSVWARCDFCGKRAEMDTADEAGWAHAVKPRHDPGALRFIIFGAGPSAWTDACRECAPFIPPDWRRGLPLWWQLMRLALRIASFLGALALYSHLFLW